MVEPPQTSPQSPPPLTTAASLVVVEALVLLALAVLELASLHGGRLTMGVTTAIFFLAAGVGLMACAWALWRLRRWGQAPVLMTQLVMLGLAWNVRATALVALALAAVALVVIAGVLHPSSREAIEPDDAWT